MTPSVTKLVDIHTHLLPGIDDGPPTLEASLEMARAAVRAGTEVIAATPHLRSDFPCADVHELEVRCQGLRDRMADEGIELQVVQGAEVSLVWALEAADEELVLASYGSRGKDLLIETPTDVTQLERLVYPLRAKGFRITLAHPERAPTFQREPERLFQLRDRGLLLQVNAESLLAHRGSRARDSAERLCREGVSDVLASDGHGGAKWRPVGSLYDAVEGLATLVGCPRAEWMTYDAPTAIVDGATLPEAPAIRPARGSRGTWRRGWRASRRLAENLRGHL